MHKRIVRRSPLPDDGLPRNHRVLKRVLAAQGICSPADRDLLLERLLGYDCLSGITGGVDLLLCAFKAQQRIFIVADFDADGAWRHDGGQAILTFRALVQSECF